MKKTYHKPTMKRHGILCALTFSVTSGSDSQLKRDIDYLDNQA